jgi:anti-anti-sigma factor
MEYSSETRGDRYVVTIGGVLTFDDYDAFRQVIAEIVACTPDTVELSLTGAKMIDSAGIGMLLLANDKAGRAGKTLRLSGLKGHVAKVVELARIDQLIQID